MVKIFSGDDTDFKGDQRLALTFAAPDVDFDGCTAEVEFLGQRRTFAQVTNGGRLVFSFTADETRGMRCGVWPVIIRLRDSSGRVRTVDNTQRIKVTNDVNEAYADAEQVLAVSLLSGGVAMPEIPAELDASAADSVGQFKQKFNALLTLLRNVAAVAVIVLFGVFSANAASVATAPLDSIPGTSNVVTGVDLSGLEPGNYATVSNRAMNALQSHQSLAPATNCTDAAVAALSNAVPSIVTNEIDLGFSEWELHGIPDDLGIERYGVENPVYTLFFDPLGGGLAVLLHDGMWDGDIMNTVVSDPEATFVQLYNYTGIGGQLDITATRRRLGTQNALGLARLSDIPTNNVRKAEFSAAMRLKQDALPYPTNAIPHTAISGMPEGLTPQAVTNIIRDISRGGIWDEALQVWWTPVMSNGSLTYQATTNVNLNAED